MKTAMQELIDWIEETGQPINKKLLLKIKQLSFKEKEQIIDAYCRQWFDDRGYIWENRKEYDEIKKVAETYYNETYQNK